ncbi:CHAT domain-containing protein [Streptomyces sp. NPDC001480]|uniref:CHAT domain-containing tetratricopeptide repeat protein n=1 Tax=Streptomyces sp. NPDC001480 TaxID=3364577 RepID=UPI0036869FFB
MLEHYGAHETAAGVARRVIWLRSAAFGQGAEPTRTWRNAYGRCLLGLGQYEEILHALLPWAHLGDETASYTLSILATAYRNRGQLETAREHYERAWAIRTRLHPPTHPAVATLADSLGLLHIQRGDVVAADQCLRAALRVHLAVEGPDGLPTATSLGHLAVLNESIGSYEMALSLLDEALRIQLKRCPPEHPSVETTECNRAVVLIRLDRKAEARDVFANLLEAARSRMGENHPDVATALNNLGWAEQELGRWDLARNHYEDALDLRQRIFPANHPLLAMSLHNLGTVYSHQGQWQSAADLLRRALGIRTAIQGEQHSDTVSSYLHLADVLTAQGQAEDALRLLMRANRAELSTIQQVLTVGSASQRDRYATLAYHSVRALASLVLNFPGLPGAPDALLAALLRKRGVAGNAFRSDRAEISTAGRPELASLRDERDRVSQRLTQLAFAGPTSPDDDERHRQEIEDLIGRKEFLEAELARALADGSSEGRGLRAPDDASSLKTLLPKGTAYVEFLLTEARDYKAIRAGGDALLRRAHYLMLVVRPEQGYAVECVDLGDAERINRAAALFRTHLSGRLDTVDRALLTLEDLTGVTVDDIERELTVQLTEPLLIAVGSARRLLVVPDAELAQLPFAALPDASGQPLLHRYAISYLASGRDLEDDRLAPSSGAPRVIAAPDFDLAAPADSAPAFLAPPISDVRAPAPVLRAALPLFTTLDGAREEGKVVADLLETAPVTGPHATKAAVRQPGPAPRILHIVTHAYFLPDRGVEQAGFRQTWHASRPESLAPVVGANPMLQSGLALSGANTWLRGFPLPADAGDGFLTAAEVMTLDLHGTELVVLSACDTGLGLRHIAEGSIGLRRSFLLAGAAAVITTLWKIPDRQAAHFMASFYRLLVSGASPAEALRSAQLRHADAGQEDFTWAAFTLYTRGGPTETAAPPTDA